MSNNTEVQLNMTEIETLIRNGKFSVSAYATQIGVSQTKIRSAIVAHFGNKIEFKKGRNGGVRLTNAT